MYLSEVVCFLHVDGVEALKICCVHDSLMASLHINQPPSGNYKTSFPSLLFDFLCTMKERKNLTDGKRMGGGMRRKWGGGGEGGEVGGGGGRDYNCARLDLSPTAPLVFPIRRQLYSRRQLKGQAM